LYAIQPACDRCDLIAVIGNTGMLQSLIDDERTAGEERGLPEYGI
jgi:hypothetical protein